MGTQCRGPTTARFASFRAAILGLGVLIVARTACAAETGTAPAGPARTSTREGVHVGAGLTVGWASVVDPHRGGPWAEGSVPIDVGLSSTAYVQIEPSVVWYSFGRKGQEIAVNGTFVGPAVRSTESNWQLSLLVRSMLGVDLGRSFTMRAGPVLGVTTAHVHSELCTGSAQALITGATLIPEARVGPRQRIAFGPQIDLLWPRSPYCVYSDFDLTKPAVLHADRKPIISVLLHASLSF